MIKVRFYIDHDGEIVGFRCSSHGDKIVCAAVSALTINTVNSIECLADTGYNCEYENERFIDFRLTDEPDENAKLLLKSFELGIHSIAEEYPGEVDVGFYSSIQYPIPRNEVY